jgi:DNA-binding NtrC family response regulator
MAENCFGDIFRGIGVHSGVEGNWAMDPSRLFKCRVLVVDDDPLVLQMTAAILRSFGYSVRTAEGGFVALKILREVLPDIILSDLRMPGMSGFELLSIVRRRFPHIPTIRPPHTSGPRTALSPID